MTSTLVVDASVLVDALCHPAERGEAARATIAGTSLAGPEHLRVETFHVIRKLAHKGEITDEAGARAVGRLDLLPIHTVQTRALLKRMWELRANLTGHDAAYAAVAEHLHVELVTRDGGILAAPGIACVVRQPELRKSHPGEVYQSDR